MKKILFLFGVFFATTLVSNAYVEEGTTSDINHLRNQGYSESILQVVDLAKYNNQGSERTYARTFNPKSSKNNFYSKLKVYLDPIQDDGDFGSHQVNFSNTWMGDETSYSSNLKNIDGNNRNYIENL